MCAASSTVQLQNSTTVVHSEAASAGSVSVCHPAAVAGDHLPGKPSVPGLLPAAVQPVCPRGRACHSRGPLSPPGLAPATAAQHQHQPVGREVWARWMGQFIGPGDWVGGIWCQQWGGGPCLALAFAKLCCAMLGPSSACQSAPCPHLDTLWRKSAAVS